MRKFLTILSETMAILLTILGVFKLQLCSAKRSSRTWREN